MADRKPLVLVDGQMQQLQSADVLAIASIDQSDISLDNVSAGSTNVHLTTTLKSAYDGAASHKTTEDAISGLVKCNGAGTYSAVTDSSTNWNTAYGWGDHGAEGYLTAEADTLDTVTDRGASTANGITVGNLTDSGLTSGRIPYASTAGLLVDSANITVTNEVLNQYKYLITTGNSLGIGTWSSSLLQIYVSTAGSDVTGVGSAVNPFATIAHVLDWLSTKSLASTCTLKIILGDGEHAISSATVWSHKDSDRFTLTGQNYYTVTLSSVQSSSGSSGSYSIVLNVSSVANIAVDDYLLVSPAITGGTYPASLHGVWKITNVDGVNTRITVASTLVGTDVPSGAVTGSVTVLKSRIKSTNHGFVIYGGALLLLTYGVLEGSDVSNSVGFNVLSGGAARIYTGGLTHFFYGTNTQAGSAALLGLAGISSCQRGVCGEGLNYLQVAGCVGNSIGALSTAVSLLAADSTITGSIIDYSIYANIYSSVASGRVMYATTGGQPVGSANLTFDGTSLQAGGYKSSDGSAGTTGSFTSADSKTVTVKNGLITSIA